MPAHHAEVLNAALASLREAGHPRDLTTAITLAQHVLEAVLDDPAFRSPLVHPAVRLTWEEMINACWMLRRDVEFRSAHPDFVGVRYDFLKELTSAILKEHPELQYRVNFPPRNGHAVKQPCA